jgi:hypothetical protein
VIKESGGFSDNLLKRRKNFDYYLSTRKKYIFKVTAKVKAFDDKAEVN